MNLYSALHNSLSPLSLKCSDMALPATHTRTI